MTVPVYGGRARTFKTPQELDQKLTEYKTYVEEKRKQEDKFTPTLQGFCVFADVLRHDLFQETANDPAHKVFHPVIKKIRQYCESELVERALSGKAQPIFSMFLLKCNYDYQDKQVIESNVNMNFDLRNLHSRAGELSQAAAVEVIDAPESSQEEESSEKV